MLQIQGISASVSGRTILDAVSLEVERGRVVGLLGPNGAGKTTCFRAILGLVDCQRGSILLDDEDIGALPMHLRARRGIGYLPQEASIFRGLPVSRNVMAVLELQPGLDRRERRERLAALLDDLQISHLARQLGGQLSGGERRRAELARTLAASPSFVLLDEPFAGVDPISVTEIRKLARHLTDRGIGVLVTDHNVRETLGLCDYAYILSGGRVLAEGAPQAIVDNPEVRGAYLGDDFAL